MNESLDNPNGPQVEEPSPDLSLHTAPRRVSGLRRRTIRLAVALLAAIVAAALIIGLGIGVHSHQSDDLRKVEPPSENMQPSPIADLPSSYAEVPKRIRAVAVTIPDPMDGMHHHDNAGPTTMAADSQKEDLARLLSSIQQIGRKNQELAQQLAAYQSAAAEQQAKVWGSPLFFKIDQAPDRQPRERSAGPEQSTVNAAIASKPKGAGTLNVSGPPSQRAITSSQTDQQQKLSFLTGSSTPRVDLDQSSLKRNPANGPSNGYLLQTGTVIPAALLTGINTDLPGDVIASVTENVYDSPTGNHLLIPQGARLYGTYDSQIAASQDRALLVWHRLLLPDGRSVDLDRMRGTDAGGYAGLADRVDYHADKLATAAVLSGVVAYAGNLAAGRQQTLALTPGDVVGNAVAQQASNTGSSIVQRQLNVQPTITIRPGWPVRVLVNRDIVLPPYAN